MSLLLIGIVALTHAYAAQRPARTFGYFVGSWRCEGHFEPSKRPIASTMEFTLTQATEELAKTHTDLPPAQYRAEERWTYLKSSKSFRSVVTVPTGQTRTYASPGWQSGQITWSRIERAGAPEDQFLYRRVDRNVMTVDWRIDRGNGLELGDTLTCRRS